MFIYEFTLNTHLRDSVREVWEVWYFLEICVRLDYAYSV